MIGVLIDAGVDINVQATDVSKIEEIIGVLIDAGVDIKKTSMYRLQM